METVLSIDRLSKKYGKIQAVKTLSLEVQKGQIFGLLGPNGSGKTTTLSVILDLVKADNGSFQWFGSTPSKESRKRIGSVIESPNFFPYLNPVKNLEIVAEIKGLDYSDIKRVLTLTGLFERKKSKFKTFSFGMKQRLAIASALLGHPEILILDEPTNGLDPQGIAHIRELILKIAGEGTTIILASHLLDEVQKICSHVAVLNKGTKLFDGEVSEVLAISNSFELSSSSMEELQKAIRNFPGYKSHTSTVNLINVSFNKEVKPEDLNEFCFRHGIILTHLSERKRSLEQHFLELLQENQ
ncbi:MAG: ATP-binding cassette domain-containing protein [Bacteroidales bacterium]|nr:ATP-binding cassette domain-containing protein [Bacteroidales bacterium]MDD4603314.1 ATP-binding cassette domain-containing protein [Bacteroidales bacterium]